MYYKNNLNKILKEYFKCISANQRNIKVLSPAENINQLILYETNNYKK